MASIARLLPRLEGAARYVKTPGAHTLMTSIAVGCLGALSGVLVARLLGPSGRGELAAVVSWSGFALGIATLGFDDALTYRGPALVKDEISMHAY